LTGNHFFDDLNEVKSSISEADVISLFFPYFGKTVLIDTRSSKDNGPAIFLTEMTRSPQERIKSMKTLRPGFPDVQKMILVPWIRYVATLADSGVWDTIISRLDDCNYMNAQEAADSIFSELRTLEIKELKKVITGTSYRTIWSR
jgi:hypothetical protein